MKTTKGERGDEGMRELTIFLLLAVFTASNDKKSNITISVGYKKLISEQT